MEKLKKTKTRRKYDGDFKAQVLKMANNGQPVTQIAQALGIGEALIYRWKKEQTVDSILTNSSLAQENQHLRAKLRESELEKEILKKALSIFSRSLLH